MRAKVSTGEARELLSEWGCSLFALAHTKGIVNHKRKLLIIDHAQFQLRPFAIRPIYICRVLEKQR